MGFLAKHFHDKQEFTTDSIAANANSFMTKMGALSMVIAFGAASLLGAPALAGTAVASGMAAISGAVIGGVGAGALSLAATGAWKIWAHFSGQEYDDVAQKSNSTRTAAPSLGLHSQPA